MIPVATIPAAPFDVWGVMARRIAADTQPPPPSPEPGPTPAPPPPPPPQGP